MAETRQVIATHRSARGNEVVSMEFTSGYYRSRLRRSPGQTRYSMCRFKALEKLSSRVDLASFRILHALADTLLRIVSGGNVKQALIGFVHWAQLVRKRERKQRQSRHRSDVLFAVHRIGDGIVDHLCSQILLPDERSGARIDRL